MLKELFMDIYVNEANFINFHQRYDCRPFNLKTQAQAKSPDKLHKELIFISQKISQQEIQFN